MRPLTCSADAPNMHRQPAAQAAGMPSSNKARMLFPSAPASSCADKRPLPKAVQHRKQKMHTGPTADRPSKSSSVAAAARAAYSAQNSPAADVGAETEKSPHQHWQKIAQHLLLRGIADRLQSPCSRRAQQKGRRQQAAIPAGMPHAAVQPFRLLCDAIRHCFSGVQGLRNRLLRGTGLCRGAAAKAP